MPPNFQLYKRVISYVNGLLKFTNVITSLCYRLVVNDGIDSSVTNTISILPSMWCVPRSYVCTINKTTYPVSTYIDDSLAISLAM